MTLDYSSSANEPPATNPSSHGLPSLNRQLINGQSVNRPPFSRQSLNRQSLNRSSISRPSVYTPSSNPPYVGIPGLGIPNLHGPTSSGSNLPRDDLEGIAASLKRTPMWDWKKDLKRLNPTFDPAEELRKAAQPGWNYDDELAKWRAERAEAAKKKEEAKKK